MLHPAPQAAETDVRRQARVANRPAFGYIPWHGYDTSLLEMRR